MLNRFSCIQLFDTRTVTCQAPLSLGLFQARMLEWVPVPPGGLLGPGIEPMSPEAPTLQVDSLPLSQLGSP